MLEGYKKNDILLVRYPWMTKPLLLVAMNPGRKLYLCREIGV